MTAFSDKITIEGASEKLASVINRLERGDYRLDNGKMTYYLRVYGDDAKLDLMVVNGVKIGYEKIQDLNGTGLALVRELNIGTFTVAILRTTGMTWTLEKVEA